MKTIKDFKDAGLVFVKGDSGSGFTVGDAEGFNLDNIWDYLKPESFAWRTNTGVKPEFDGDIDIMFKDHDNIYYREESAFYWVDGGVESGMAKWRPHLPKVEDKPKSPYDVDAHVSDSLGERLKRAYLPIKPIFTQAMADAGELPPVGSECMVNYQGWVHAKYMGKGMDGYHVVSYKPSEKQLLNMRYPKW